MPTKIEQKGLLDCPTLANVKKEMAKPRMAKSARIAERNLDNTRISEYTLGLADGLENMQDDEWIKNLEDGRKVKFTYLKLAESGAFITAQIAGNEVVYSVVLTHAKNPLSHNDVESHFEGELSKKLDRWPM
jgi:hypothetical protein